MCSCLGGSDAKLEKKVKELSEHLKRYKENGSLALKKIKALTAEKEETAKDIQELPFGFVLNLSLLNLHTDCRRRKKRYPC